MLERWLRIAEDNHCSSCPPTWITRNMIYNIRITQIVTPSHIDCCYVNATMFAIRVVDLTVKNIELLRPVMEMQEWFPLALLSP
jgi:hypothetical protein